MKNISIEDDHLLPNPAINRESRSWADRLLGIFTKVNPGEAATAILLAINVFLLLGLYYLLKTVREALILSESGAEIKSYSSAGQAILLLLIVPAYGMLASRVPRFKLIAFVTAFFALNLIVFAALGLSGVRVGVPFFLWIGIFNLLIVAQFWALANDIYTEAQGKRLFPFIGAGASLGAIFGAQIAKSMFNQFGSYWVMVISAIALLFSLVLTWLANHRATTSAATQKNNQVASQPLSKEGGFKLVFSNRYLFLIAMLFVVLNIVNTVGEYILGKFILSQATQMGLSGAAEQNFIGGFYGDFFWWVNVISFCFQLFIVWRLFKWIGVRGTLFVLPLLALVGYGTLLFIPILSVVRLSKILENSTDYSIQKTTSQALFLPTSREAKYKAKTAIETFFWRAGDVLQAGIVLLGTSLGLGMAAFARINIVLVLIWLGMAALIYREHRRISNEK